MFAVPVIICSFFSIGTSVTVTLHVWLTLLPSNAETLIFAVPALTAFTIPFSSTVTTFLLVDSHFTAGSDALAGNTVAVNCLSVNCYTSRIAKCIARYRLRSGWYRYLC